MAGMKPEIPVDFSFLPFTSNWVELDHLSASYNQCGPKLRNVGGVCCTNACLALIISCPKLLEYLVDRINSTAEQRTRLKATVLRDPHCTSLKPCRDVRSIDLLLDAVDKASRCELTGSTIMGPSSDFYLANYYEMRLDEVNPERDERFRKYYDNYRTDEFECLKIVQENLRANSDYDRWQVILMNSFIFDEDEAQIFQYKPYWMLQFFMPQSILSIQLTNRLANIERNVWSYNTIARDPLAQMPPIPVKALRRCLKRYLGVPNILILSYESKSGLRIHHSFLKIIAIAFNYFYTYSKGDPGMKFKIPQNFEVGMERANWNLPLWLNEKDLNFQIELSTGKYQYEIRGMNFYISQPYVLKYEDIMDYHNYEDRPQVNECKNIYYRRLYQLVKDTHPNDRAILDKLKEESKKILLLIGAICRLAADTYRRKNRKQNNGWPVHQFSLINMEERGWMLVNDDKPIPIANLNRVIKSFRYMGITGIMTQLVNNQSNDNTLS
ncbi:hypothetical protein SNEBB_009286 [Seison nebaliae]|nr:hypothetical protein SNEBB_009286 [Seison nebaliae]